MTMIIVDTCIWAIFMLALGLERVRSVAEHIA